VIGLRPLEYYSFTEQEYLELLEGWQLKEQKEWEKVRLLAWYAGNSQSMKPIRDIRKIMQLPLIDGEVTDREAYAKERIRQAKEMILATQKGPS
jgi:hypothetical protein